MKTTFDYAKFQMLQNILKKDAQFVPMPGGGGGAMPPDAGMAPPPEGGSMPPDAGMAPPPEGAAPPPDAGMAPPPEGAMPPPDAGMAPPPEGAMPPPDAMAGMPPMDDPAASGDVSPTGEPYMKITPTQLSKLFKQFAEVFKSVLGIQSQPGGTQVAQAPQVDQSQLTEVNAKLDALLRG